MPVSNLRPFVPLEMADEKEHRRRLANQANTSLSYEGTNLMVAPLRLADYTVATVPAASLWTNGLIAVTDETGGFTLAYSDGTNWRRVQDRAIIS